MVRSVLGRSALAAGATLLLALVAVSPALAKEGIEVQLNAQIPADAKPGDTVSLFFTLTRIDENGMSPLRGSPVYVRLLGPRGDATEADAGETRTPGTYQAAVVIPAGGAARVEFGIHGAAVDADGRASGADLIWPYDGRLVAAAPAAPDPVASNRPATRPVVQPAARLAPRAVAEPTAGPAAAIGAPPSTTAASVSTGIDARLGLAGLAAMIVAITVAIAAALARARRRPRPTAA
jgi:hypothetical protein